MRSLPRILRKKRPKRKTVLVSRESDCDECIRSLRRYTEVDELLGAIRLVGSHRFLFRWYFPRSDIPFRGNTFVTAIFADIFDGKLDPPAE
jgi:hypothetical protein